MWLKQQEDYGLLTSCTYCKSTRINRIKSKEELLDNGTKLYTATYECMDCHATATCQETWNEPKSQ